MKLENIPADIKSKSLKEAREEIDTILSKLESHNINLDDSKKDYQRLIQLPECLFYRYQLGQQHVMLYFSQDNSFLNFL